MVFIEQLVTEYQTKIGCILPLVSPYGLGGCYPDRRVGLFHSRPLLCLPPSMGPYGVRLIVVDMLGRRSALSVAAGTLSRLAIDVDFEARSCPLVEALQRSIEVRMTGHHLSP